MGRLAEEFERINGMQLRIVTEGAVFVGEYKDNSDSILTAQSSFEAKVPEVSEADDSGDTSATESIAEDENVLAKSELAEEHNSCGSTHSMVLPSLPKESTILASSEYYDATSDAADYSKKDSMVDDEDDYDIISGAEDEDTASDFEVLSAVSSNNQ